VNKHMDAEAVKNRLYRDRIKRAHAASTVPAVPIDEEANRRYDSDMRMEIAVRQANYVAQRWGTKAWSNWGGVHE